MSRPMVSNDSAKTIWTPRAGKRTRPSARTRDSMAGTRAPTSSSRQSRAARARQQVRREIRMRQHHALGLAGRARCVDDGRELDGRDRPRRVAEMLARRPTRPHAARGLARPLLRAGGRKATSRRPLGPSTTTASSAGNRCRISCSLSSCASVETTASRRRNPGGCSALALPKSVGINRDGTRPGREDREVDRGSTRAGSRQEWRRDPRSHAQGPEAEREVADALEEVLPRDAWTSPPRCAADDHRVLKPPHDVERQVGDGPDVRLHYGMLDGIWHGK